MYQAKLLIVLTFITLLVDGQAFSQSYSWKNAKIGGGGGFVPGIIFNPSEKVCKATFSIARGLTTFLRDSHTPAQTSVGPTSWNPMIPGHLCLILWTIHDGTTGV